MHADDMDLVREFAANGSEAAFATLVRRHVNLVYSAALRWLGNAAEAEEVAQIVFLILAKKARRLRRGTILSGWLYQTAQLTAANHQRAAIRRQHREQEAFMQFSEQSEPDVSWHRLSPLLEEAMARLGQKERAAIVLRFFENRTVREVAAALGLREDAAQKRVNRATDKLRDYFVRRGIQVSSAVLLASIGTHAVQAAPAELASKIVAGGVLKGALGGASTLTLKTTLKIMAWTKAKTAIVAAVAVVVATGTTTLVVHHEQRALPKPQPVVPTETDFPKSSWHFAGYGSPESALMSMVWAVSNNDGHNFRNSLAPAMQQQFVGKPDRALIGADDQRDFARITGYRILDKQVLSENEVVLTGFAGGLNETQKFRFQRLGDEWKYDGHLKIVIPSRLDQFSGHLAGEMVNK